MNDEWGNGWQRGPDDPPLVPENQPMPMTISGMTDADRERQRAMRAPAAAPGPQTLAQQAYSALFDIRRLQQQRYSEIAAECNSDPAVYGPAYEQKRRAEFAKTATAKMPEAIAVAVEKRLDEAEDKRRALMGSMTEAGDGGQEIRNERLLRQFERRLDRADAEGREIAEAQPAIAEAKTRSERGLLADEIRSRYVETDWLDRTLAAADPELAAADREVQQAKQEYRVIAEGGRMVSDGIRNGRPVAPGLLETFGTGSDQIRP
jgi:hypothetical protein